EQPLADQLGTFALPESAARLVDERQRRVRTEPADQFALGIEHAAIPPLGLRQRGLGAPPSPALEIEGANQRQAAAQPDPDRCPTGSCEGSHGGDTSDARDASARSTGRSRIPSGQAEIIGGLVWMPDPHTFS